MKTLGIIPARFESTRFPGKPLIDIGGKSMIQRVYQQAIKVFAEVYVATDDQRIFDHVKEFGKVIMTSPHHKTGTDRCKEAVEKILGKNTDDCIVVNIQGDEPFISEEALRSLLTVFNNPDTEVATLVKKIEDYETLFNANTPKVIFTQNKQALYFSRTTIPFVRNAPAKEWLNHFNYYKHIGIYAFRYSVLQRLADLPQSSLELAESLEQNRWLENGIRIFVETTEYESIAVDTPADLEKITQLLRKNIF